MEMSTLLAALAEMAILMVLGLVLNFFGLFKQELQKGISGLLVNVTTPALIVYALTDALGQINGNQVGFFLGAAFIVILFQWFSSKLLTLAAGSDEPEMVRITAVFKNITYVALPISAALFGSVGVVFSFLFSLVHDLAFWTICPMVLDQKRVSLFRKLLQPPLIALCLGIVLGLTSVQFPVLIDRSLQSVGNLTIPLALLLLGASCRFSLDGLRKNIKTILLVILYSLCVIPLIVMAVLKLTDLHSTDIWTILLIHTAAPGAAFSIVLADRYNRNAEKTAQLVVIPTIASLVTIPILLMLWT